MQKNKDQAGSLRVNQEIRALEVRLVDQEGEAVGVVRVEEALRLAQEAGMDLVEVSPKVVPPVCRLMDYGRFRYEQQKKRNEAKKKQKIIDTKEVQIRPRIDKHDLDVKLGAARKFLANGDKVKITMHFRGREISYQHLGLEVLNKVVEALGEHAKVDVPPKLEGRQYMMVLSSNVKE